MTKTAKHAKHMRQNANLTGRQKRRARVVALALAGVLAIGGVGAVCIAGASNSPGQVPVATLQQVGKQATKPATQQANGQTHKAVEKNGGSQATAKPTAQATKPATQQGNQATKPAMLQATQQQRGNQTLKPAATQQANQTTKPAAQQGGGSGSGLEAKVSREQCIRTACAHVGAGGQAKGEARNVTARQVTGGGTVYYVVELDLGDVHYTVNVDAIDGGVIGSDCTHAGKRMLLDKDGNPVEGTEQPADE